MDPVTRAWAQLWQMPGLNAWVFVSTLLIGLVLLWATAGALLTSAQRYPPRRRGHYTRRERVRGRRAWATVAVLGAYTVWSAYRLDALWVLDSPVSDRAFVVDAIRGASIVWLSWAWWPGSGAE